MRATWRGTIAFSVNGSPVEIGGPAGRRLIDVLRHDLLLTGTKEGCGEGECGACSVLIDGEVVNSCLVPICQVAGRSVVTVEGLTRDGQLGELQAAFLETGAVQCGFCTPGFLLAGQAFVASGAPATDEAIREAIAGNLCRCTGYTAIVEGIRRAAVAREPAAAGRSVAAWGVPAAAGTLAAFEPFPMTGGGPPTGTPPSVSGEVLRAPVAPVHVECPATLDAALRALADAHLRPIAGGTDVMVELASRSEPAATPLLDISAIGELRGIRLDHDAILVGALTTYAALRRSPLVQERLPELADVAASVGAAQIQNRGTVGGNIATASPAGDLLPLLLATDATIVAGSVRGVREIAADAFWVAYRRTALAADELVLRVRIPVPAGREVRVRKVGTRRAQAIAKVSIAVAWRPDDDGRWRNVRVALGSVADRPIRASQTEAFLEGAEPGAGTADRAARMVAAEITPIDDVRSTAAYRRAVAGRVLRRLLLDAGAR